MDRGQLESELRIILKTVGSYLALDIAKRLSYRLVKTTFLAIYQRLLTTRWQIYVRTPQDIAVIQINFQSNCQIRKYALLFKKW